MVWEPVSVTVGVIPPISSQFLFYLIIEMGRREPGGRGANVDSAAGFCPELLPVRIVCCAVLMYCTDGWPAFCHPQPVVCIDSEGRETGLYCTAVLYCITGFIDWPAHAAAFTDCIEATWISTVLFRVQ